MGAQGVWGTWAIGPQRVWGTRGISNRVQGYGVYGQWGTEGMGHIGNRSHGQWGTWAIGPMGHGAYGQWGPWAIGTFLPIASLLLNGFLQKFYWT